MSHDELMFSCGYELGLLHMYLAHNDVLFHRVVVLTRNVSNVRLKALTFGLRSAVKTTSNPDFCSVFLYRMWVN